MGESLINQTLHDTYRVEKQISDTGVGAVYEAAHLRLSRRYAVKVLSAEVSKRAKVTERFQKDWSILSALNHRQIAEAVDFFQLPDGRPVLVMEMLEGETLASRLQAKGRFEVAEAALILRQVSSGLQTAHKKRVIHGDLRPAKLMLCKTREKDDFVKLVGFGSIPTDQPNEMVYTAPELIDIKGEPPEKLDHRSDSYSIAAMLFHMLTGSVPMSAETPEALRARIRDEEPPKIRELRTELPESVEYVIAKSLRKDPQRRYPSLGALSREFSSTLAL